MQKGVRLMVYEQGQMCNMNCGYELLLENLQSMVQLDFSHVRDVNLRLTCCLSRPFLVRVCMTSA